MFFRRLKQKFLVGIGVNEKHSEVEKKKPQIILNDANKRSNLVHEGHHSPSSLLRTLSIIKEEEVGWIPESKPESILQDSNSWFWIYKVVNF